MSIAAGSAAASNFRHFYWRYKLVMDTVVEIAYKATTCLILVMYPLLISPIIYSVKPWQTIWPYSAGVSDFCIAGDEWITFNQYALAWGRAHANLLMEIDFIIPIVRF